MTPQRRGFALILVLVFLGIISGLVLQAQLSSRASLRQEAALADKVKLRASATDAVLSVLKQIADDASLEVDDLKEPWLGIFDYETPEGTKLFVRVTDENGKFDINNLTVQTTQMPLRAPESIMADIMTLCGDFTPSDRLDALVDWVDADDEGFREDDFYLGRDESYETPDRALTGWREMLWIEGFDKEYFRRHSRRSAGQAFSEDFVDAFTTIPGARNGFNKVNINSAGRAVLLGLLGLARDDLVDYVLVMREDHPFHNLDALAMTISDALYWEEIRPYLGVQSSFYRIEVTAMTGDQAVTVLALSERNADGDVKVVQWIM
ncbi:MAG: general secretion pathway protein GspK [Verrucomicrobia bacterium]|nr:general secretion pathway protein GspK [Verrucomicrobiota bacterium]